MNVVPLPHVLAKLCAIHGGRHIVSAEEVDSLRSFLGRLGRRVFDDAPTLSAYVFRAQRLADIKATFGDDAAAAAASAAGHCSDRSQRHYGFAAHGRKGGIIAVHTTRPPKLVSAARGRRMRQALEETQTVVPFSEGPRTF